MPKQNKNGRQHEHFLTSIPIKNVLVDQENNRNAVNNKGKNSKSQNITLEKKILQESNDTSTSDVNTDELC